MSTIVRNSNKIAYGIKHFVVNTETELKEIPLGNVYSGSTALVLESSARYVLNNRLPWVKLAASYGSGGSTTPDSPGDIYVGLDGGLVTDAGIIDGEDEGAGGLSGGLIT